jgi:protein-disulfide isomerase
MKKRFLLALLPLALAACGKGDGNSTTPSAPVAAATPPAGQKWTEVVSKTPENGYVMGNPNAPIKLIEYGSRLCPTCGAFANTGMKPLENTYVASGKVSYEFREFMVHGAPDFAPALLGRCAGAGPFFPLLEDMFAAQPTILPKMENASAFQQKVASLPPTQMFAAWADQLGYVDFVKQRGIPEAQARACLADPKQIDVVTKLTQRGNDEGVTGTPTFFLNGKKLDVVSWDEVEKALKNAGA